MNGSWKLARIKGIDVFVHWTFALLLIWIGIAHLWRGSHYFEAVYGIVFILAIFACVVLHELGHALTARRFGIETQNITLLPIGGVAHLERMPRDPWQEFLVAIAGPAVNVVIAAVLFVFLWIVRTPERFPEDFTISDQMVGGPLLLNLLIVNIMLVVFNMLPAFPMDGGRVLRAVLASRMDYAKATSIAASVGQTLAIVLGILGLFGNALLVLVAAFVYLGAAGESRMVQLTEALRGLTVRDAMMRRFRTLTSDAALSRAADELLLGHQRDFPVVDDGAIVGIVRQSEIIRGIREGGIETPVSTIMKPVIPVDASAVLDDVAQQMKLEQHGAMPVVHNGALAGMLSLENIGELVMIRSALRGEVAARNLDKAIGRDERPELTDAVSST